MATQMVMQRGGAAALAADDHEVGEDAPARVEHPGANASADPYLPQRATPGHHPHVRAGYAVVLSDDSTG